MEEESIGFETSRNWLKEEIFYRMLGIVGWLLCLWLCFWVIPAEDGRYAGPGVSENLLINISENEFPSRFPSGRHRQVDLVEAKLNQPPDDYFGQIDTVHLRLFDFEVWAPFQLRTKGELRILEIYDANTVFTWKFTHPSLAGLTHLVLDGVGLYYLNDGPNELTSLRFLEVRDSFVRWIHPRGFSNLKELRTLCLSGNWLREFRSEYLPRPALYLWHLDLSFNRIQNLPLDLFDHSPELRELKVDHNRLKYIQDWASHLPSLRELWTGDNPTCSNCSQWTCYCFPFPDSSPERPSPERPSSECI